MRSLPPPRQSRHRQLRRLWYSIIFYFQKGYIDDAEAFNIFSRHYRKSRNSNNDKQNSMKRRRFHHRNRRIMNRWSKQMGKTTLGKIPGGDSTINNYERAKRFKNGIGWMVGFVAPDRLPKIDFSFKV